MVNIRHLAPVKPKTLLRCDTKLSSPGRPQAIFSGNQGRNKRVRCLSNFSLQDHTISSVFMLVRETRLFKQNTNKIWNDIGTQPHRRTGRYFHQRNKIAMINAILFVYFWNKHQLGFYSQLGRRWPFLHVWEGKFYLPKLCSIGCTPTVGSRGGKKIKKFEFHLGASPR